MVPSLYNTYPTAPTPDVSQHALPKSLIVKRGGLPLKLAPPCTYTVFVSPPKRDRSAFSFVWHCRTMGSLRKRHASGSLGLVNSLLPAAPHLAWPSALGFLVGAALWRELLPGLPNSLRLLRLSDGEGLCLSSCLRLSIGDGECILRPHLRIVALPVVQRLDRSVRSTSKLSHQVVARWNKCSDPMRSSATYFCAFSICRSSSVNCAFILASSAISFKMSSGTFVPSTQVLLPDAISISGMERSPRDRCVQPRCESPEYPSGMRGCLPSSDLSPVLEEGPNHRL